MKKQIEAVSDGIVGGFLLGVAISLLLFAYSPNYSMGMSKEYALIGAIPMILLGVFLIGTGVWSATKT